jgi:hypothetical protein
MQITRQPNESTAGFTARVFRVNHQLDLLRKEAVFTENNETMPGPARPWITIGEAFPTAKFVKIITPPQRMLRSTFSASPLPAGALEFRTTATGTLLIDAPTGATPCTPAELRAMGALHDLYQPPRMTRLRAIWYGSGLVFGVVCIAMAVFGMGQ